MVEDLPCFLWEGLARTISKTIEKMEAKMRTLSIKSSSAAQKSFSQLFAMSGGL